MVGFTGSRNLPAQYHQLIARVVVPLAVRGIAVGCARGADSLVYNTAPSLAQVTVFKASAYSGPPAARLVKRSVAMVQAVAASGQPLVVGFISSPCPPGLSPSSKPAACFNGSGSGTWATLAYAAGLGLPVIVFWCSSAPAALPVAWGSWSPAGGYISSLGGMQLSPTQSKLF